MARAWTTTLVLAASLAAWGCVRTAGSGRDTTRPLVKITVLESRPPQTFTSDEGALADACAKVRSVPTTITVTAADSGGIASVWVRSFPGRIRNVRMAPPPPETQVGITPDPGGDLLSARVVRRRDGRVQVSTVVTLDVSEPAALRAGATDLAGNSNEVGQVDIRLTTDPVVCRGDSGATD